MNVSTKSTSAGAHPASAQRPVILLTAAVTPNVTVGVRLVDPGERMRQYRESIQTWVQCADQHDYRLVIVESTGATEGDILAELDSLQRRRIDFLNVHPTLEAQERGKGAVESQMIDAAVSELGDTDETIYKITGRLTLANAARCLIPLAENSVCARVTIDGKWADTRVIGATSYVWKSHLSNMARDVDDNKRRFLEHVSAYRIRKAEFESNVNLRRFKQRPIILGASGSTGKRYNIAGQRIRARAFSVAENTFGQLAAVKQW